jgi:hypothetical protein
MQLTKLLTLWPPFDATAFIRVPESPAHLHELLGASTQLYFLIGASAEQYEATGLAAQLYVLEGCE